MRKILVFLFLISSFVGFSQEDAWVYFKDKPDAAAFFINPLSELSQRALDRRSAQGIALDVKDAPIFQTYINDITNATGIIVKAKSKWLNCLHIRGSKIDINALKLLSFVKTIDFANKTLNTVAKSSTKQNAVPINKTMDTKVSFNYGSSSNQIKMLNGHLLHQLNYTGTGKIIAVLDSGFPGVDIATPFKRLRDNNQILGGYDYVNRSANFYAANDHGTFVLSSMGGYIDGQLVGTAPDAKYYLYITEDAISAFPYSENPVEESNWVEAAEAADRVGVDIITTSLGYFGYDNPVYSHVYSDMTGDLAFASQGANIAFEKGIIVVASAGNAGQEIEPHIGIPAEAKNVIAVGAVKSDKTLALFSSIGPSFDGRVKPDVMAQGQLAVLSDPAGNIVTANGTSFSCPILAGMVACLWQALPEKNAQQIKQLILQASDNFNSIVKSRNQYGYGIPDFNLALANGLSIDAISKNDFVVYPNPTSDIISMTLPKVSNVITIAIYNVLGQLVLENNISSQSPAVSLKSLNSGIYFYRIEADGVSTSGKIIKQ